MKNKLVVPLAIAFIALLFLLLRENEAKVAAQNQLKNTQFKATSVINEKGNAISELETQAAELQAKVQENEENSQKALAANAEEISGLVAQSEAKAAQHEEELGQKNKRMGDLEEEIRQNSDRFEKTLKKKNTELTGMGEELRKTTERLASTLKKQETIESENFTQREKIADLEREGRKLKDELKDQQARLEGVIKASQDKPAALD